MKNRLSVIPFLYADDLKKQYIVYGSFYNMSDNGEVTHCRNLLEIYEKSYFATNKFTNIISVLPSSLTSLQLKQPQHQGIPDAIFIMMNPGSCKPIQPGYIVPTFKMDSNLPENIITNLLVIAKPDTTQYQIMRVMAYRKWRHVRIINISDIREPKSSLFFKKVAAFTTDVHTIFSQNRTTELESALTADNTPTFAAWGQDKTLIHLATQCFQSITQIRPLKGVQTETNLPLYAHASPTLKEHKLEWLKQIHGIIN